mgnify:CR=1 FL=1
MLNVQLLWLIATFGMLSTPSWPTSSKLFTKIDLSDYSNDNYFNNSAKLIAELTGIEIDDILYNPNINISSYAKALAITTNNSKNIYEYLNSIKDLSDLPKDSHNQQFT